MNKISYSSRYYDALQTLKSKLNSVNYFKLIRNEEKGTYSLPYLYEDYKNEIEPITVSNRIIVNIQEYFSSNLYSNEEIKLFLIELIPFLKLFGNDSIEFLEGRLKFYENQKPEDHPLYIKECAKTIASLEKVKSIVNIELTTIYTSLISNNEEVFNYNLFSPTIKKNELPRSTLLNQVYEDIIEKNRISYSLKNVGKIYIMRNANLDKNVYKIGLTTKTTDERARQLSKTSIPGKFSVMREWNVKDCVLAEKIIHKLLEKYRIDQKREFFQIDMRLANEIIDLVVDKINSEE